MATIGTATTSSHLNTPRRSYFTTSNYNQNFYTLQSSVNPNTYQTTYSLVVNPKGSPANCGSNAILRETGKKIYPGQYPGVNSYYVSVFDDTSHLTGFINPNNPLFLPLNTDKPSDVYSPNGVSDDAEEGNYGPPVNTKGTINSYGYISTQSYLHVNQFALVDQYISSGQYVHANQFVLADSYLQARTYLSTGTYANIGTYLSTGTYVRAGTYVAGGVVVQGINGTGDNTPYTNQVDCDIYLNPTLGRVYTVTLPVDVSGNANFYCGSSYQSADAYVPPAGSVIQVIITAGNNCILRINGANIVPNGSRNLLGGNTYTLTFSSDGVKLYDSSRSGSGNYVASVGTVVMNSTAQYNNISYPTTFDGQFEFTMVTDPNYIYGVSKVFVTLIGINQAGTAYSVEPIDHSVGPVPPSGNGHFWVVSRMLDNGSGGYIEDLSSLNYMIVN